MLALVVAGGAVFMLTGGSAPAGTAIIDAVPWATITAVTDGDGEAADADVPLGDLEALQGVVKFPVRIKCATLAWNTLTQALDTPT